MYEIVAIGASLGGLNAVRMLLASLPLDFPLPIAIAQHRCKKLDDGLVRMLSKISRLPVYEPEDKQSLEPATVYLAPSDYHMLIDKGRVSLSTEAPVRFARPSVDALFDSAADAYGAAVIGVILTGANADGAEGAIRIKQRGGFIVVQDPATAECPTMPQATIAAVAVDRVLPLPKIANFLTQQCGAVL